MASDFNIDIEIYGCFGNVIKSDDWLKYKTFITQSMLEKGFQQLMFILQLHIQKKIK